MRLVLSRAMVRFSPMFSSLITASILRQYCLTAQACLLIDNYNCPSYNCDYLLQLQLRHEGGLHVKIFCPPAIYANGDVLVLSSVFELNEASNEGGAAQFVSTTSSTTSVAWYNNKELLFGNDAGIDCDGGAMGFNPPACFNVTENFSEDLA